ncbi:hypothetical protein V2J09_021322 [Rumex salicifolius]
MEIRASCSHPLLLAGLVLARASCRFVPLAATLTLRLSVFSCPVFRSSIWSVLNDAPPLIGVTNDPDDDEIEIDVK